MDILKVGDFQLIWLNGGKILLDGGAMFGVVPKPIWSKRYACNELNQVELRTDPILIQANGKYLLLDSGMGNGKLDEKQKKRAGLLEESDVEESLKKLNIAPEEISFVLLTHFHNDHAAGLTRAKDGQFTPIFNKAIHYIHATEWEEALHPNIRSRNTYLKENWEPIQPMVQTFSERIEVMPGIEMIHTGGHSAGHAIVRIESQGEIVYHLADILPTRAHRNPLWVMAYDDYPMDSIKAKEKWIRQGVEEGAWFSFYHDNTYRAIKWNEDGEMIAEMRATT